MRLRKTILIAVLVAVVATIAIWRARRARLCATRTHRLAGLGPGPHDDGFARATKHRDFHFSDDHGPHRSSATSGVLDRQSRRRGRARVRFELPIFRTALAPDQDASARARGPRATLHAHFRSPTSPRGAFTPSNAPRAARSRSRVQISAVAHVGARLVGVRPRRSATALPVRPSRPRGDFAIASRATHQGKPHGAGGRRGLSRRGRSPDNASVVLLFPHAHATRTIMVRREVSTSAARVWMDARVEHARAVVRASRMEIGSRGASMTVARSCSSTAAPRRTKRLVGAVGLWCERDGTPHPSRPTTSPSSPSAPGPAPVLTFDYPAGFQARGPSSALDLQVLPLLADQELDLTFRYWEGGRPRRRDRRRKTAKGLGTSSSRIRDRSASTR